jgi:hypothetical protein
MAVRLRAKVCGCGEQNTSVRRSIDGSTPCDRTGNLGNFSIRKHLDRQSVDSAAMLVGRTDVSVAHPASRYRTFVERYTVTSESRSICVLRLNIRHVQ